MNIRQLYRKFIRSIFDHLIAEIREEVTLEFERKIEREISKVRCDVAREFQRVVKAVADIAKESRSSTTANYEFRSRIFRLETASTESGRTKFGNAVRL
jgi:hypothetical protein